LIAISDIVHVLSTEGIKTAAKLHGSLSSTYCTYSWDHRTAVKYGRHSIFAPKILNMNDGLIKVAVKQIASALAFRSLTTYETTVV